MEDSANIKTLLEGKKKKINSRTKGNSFERKVAKLLNEHYKTNEFMRTPGSGAFATTHKLPSHLLIGGDLITPSGFPYLIECKRGYKFTISDLCNYTSDFWNIWYKLEKQAKQYNKEPLLIFQQDRQNTLCMVKYLGQLTDRVGFTQCGYIFNFGSNTNIMSIQEFLTRNKYDFS